MQAFCNEQRRIERERGLHDIRVQGARSKPARGREGGRSERGMDSRRPFISFARKQYANQPLQKLTLALGAYAPSHDVRSASYHCRGTLLRNCTDKWFEMGMQKVPYGCPLPALLPIPSPIEMQGSGMW